MCFDGRKPEVGPLMRAAAAAKDRAEGRGTIPATCPACSWRDIVRGRVDPPGWFCPNCRLAWPAPADEAPPAPPSGPPTLEDRGTPLWIWRDAAGRPSFARTPGAVERVVVSVPIGWRLRPDPEAGVVLADTFGETLTAWAAWGRAVRGEGGFRWRGKEAVE